MSKLVWFGVIITIAIYLTIIGFFIWWAFLGKQKFIIFHGDRVDVKFTNPVDYRKEKNALEILKGTGVTPELISTCDDNLILTMKNGGEPLTQTNMPQDYDKQVENIAKILFDKDICHNDLGSRNILVDKEGRISVIDFQFWLPRKKSREKVCLTGPDGRKNKFPLHGGDPLPEKEKEVAKMSSFGNAIIVNKNV